MRLAIALSISVLCYSTPAPLRAQEPLPDAPRTAEDSLARDLGDCAAYYDALATATNIGAASQNANAITKARLTGAGLSLPNRNAFLARFRFSIELVQAVRQDHNQRGLDLLPDLHDAFRSSCEVLLLVLDERLARARQPPLH